MTKNKARHIRHVCSLIVVLMLLVMPSGYVTVPTYWLVLLGVCLTGLYFGVSSGLGLFPAEKKGEPYLSGQYVFVLAFWVGALTVGEAYLFSYVS